MGFKQKIVEKIKEVKDENKSVKELKQGQRVMGFYVLVSFCFFYFLSLYSLSLLFGINELFALAATAVFCGVLMLLFALLMIHQSLYIFLRKQSCMVEKEDFEDIMGDNDSNAAE